VSIPQGVIHSITPFSTLDYKDHLSAIIWFGGCNMRCIYCYNKDIVLLEPTITTDQALKFLQSRKNLLDGVVISGGEATIHKELFDFILKVKKLAFDIKLDTNGSNPGLISKLLNLKMVDFISLDFKAPKYSHESITGSKLYDKTIDSLKLLIKSDVRFEVRTTVHSDILSIKDIENINKELKDLNSKAPYFIQNFQNGCQYLGSINEQETPLDLQSLNINTRNF
jgi:pyruvate formate lyase activating enzyme